MTHHRNPLFGVSVHVSLFDTVAIDWLHTLSLGIFQDFLGELVNHLIDQNAWQVPGAASVCRKLSVSRLQAGLFAFCSAQRQQGIAYSEVQRLDDTMFGKSGSPKCKLHGAETNGLLQFASTLIAQFEPLFAQPRIWQRTCQALLRLRRLCDKVPEMWVPSDTQEPRLTIQTNK